ncbi:glycosyltransferase family 2 protein [Microvirga pudoricolor]|uniref:glycosyltransferase family 2 protein n=1 Tax=Microvirga pudoricolor TaxID=2778729 RepID=UPI001950AAF5|nr:glycosyltransferase family 2 protein [Microvirga pudoricolor]MBM6593708.1 glycosyltransferase [Microvirga pudoricolor]
MQQKALRLRFTIVTPTLNRRDMLAQALDSVAAQEHGSVEHLVVDGGSTDGTLEMLAGRPGVTVLADRRRGLYDAINLGIERASGDVIGLLNSDDLYPAGTFSAVERAFAASPGTDAVCGAAELFDETGTLARYDDPRDLGLDAHAALIGACIPNARFFRRTVFERIGGFSLDYPHVADRDFLSRFLMAGLKTAPIDALTCRYRRHGGSLTFAAGAERGEGLRGELLRLARAIEADPRATPALKRKARALEGRCLVSLARARLRSDGPGAALRLLAARDGHLSAAPVQALTAGIWDKLSTRRG